MQAHLKFQQALALHQHGQLTQAQALYEGVLKKHPKHFDALHMLGVLAYQTRRLDRAASLIAKAIGIDPDVAAAHNNYGNVLQDLRRLDAALVSYNKAIGIDPHYAEAHNNRGDCLQTLGRWDAALASYDRAIALAPHYAGALYNRGNALKALGRFEQAIESYDMALKIAPQDVDIHHNLGHALAELKRYDEAVSCYDKALELKAAIPYLSGTRLNLKMHQCDWSGFERAHLALLQDVADHKKVCPPFPFLALTDDPALQLKAAQVWMQDKFGRLGTARGTFKPFKHKRLRIGYFSADFWNHPVAQLIAGVLESHDREQFEIYGFSSGPDTQDPMRLRLENAFEHFIDVKAQSDADVVALARSLEIDVAIDLSGLTKGCRPGLFVAGVAPVQLNYLGYPGTMGENHFDYIVADQTLIPQTHQQFYSEKIIYLPGSYQANDRKRQIADKSFSRQDLGLPESGFVFCCFNNNYKILPETFKRWLRILLRVPGSVLWLMDGSQSTVSHLRREACAQGIEADRLVFARHMPLDQHLARHAQADLFLDTLPYNAHTTASDALWAGLPVLTIMGQSFASRVAASLLNAIQLPELIAENDEDFEARAIALALHPEKLQGIRNTLKANRLTTSLFDTARSTRHLESAYQQAFARHAAKLPTEHLYIEN